jgi:hypothetical protein
VPPQQCPECGRFLKKDLVASLSTEPTPCPRCETDLVAAMFAVGPVPAAQVADAEAPAGQPAPGGSTEPSVRPPDLPPTEVRDRPADVLEGWDRESGPPPVVDQAPFPLDAVVLGGAGLAGALLGALFGERGCRGAVLGAVGGVLGAAAARRVWRLE